jgi:hypothetical protein
VGHACRLEPIPTSFCKHLRTVQLDVPCHFRGVSSSDDLKLLNIKSLRRDCFVKVQALPKQTPSVVLG